MAVEVDEIHELKQEIYKLEKQLTAANKCVEAADLMEKKLNWFLFEFSTDEEHYTAHDSYRELRAIYAKLTAAS